MGSIKIGLLIWYKTIIVTAFLFAGITMFNNAGNALLGLVVILFGGLILTCPLLLLIIPVVGWSEKIPYNIQGRMAWLTFYLAALIIGMFALFTRHTFTNEFVSRVMGMTIAGVLVAVVFTRQSLTKLYNQDHEIR